MQENTPIRLAATVQAIAKIVIADPKSVGFGKIGSCFKQD